MKLVEQNWIMLSSLFFKIVDVFVSHLVKPLLKCSSTHNPHWKMGNKWKLNAKIDPFSKPQWAGKHYFWSEIDNRCDCLAKGSKWKWCCVCRIDIWLYFVFQSLFQTLLNIFHYYRSFIANRYTVQFGTFSGQTFINLS